MERTLIKIAAMGAAVSAGFGVVAGTGLRVEPPAPEPWEMAAVDTLPASFESAPGYPAWAPPPLYGGREEDEGFDFTAWLPGLENEADYAPRPVRFEPPKDLPPPYEVRLASDEERSGGHMGPPPPRMAPPPGPVRYIRVGRPIDPPVDRPRHAPPPPPSPSRADAPSARAWLGPDGHVTVEVAAAPPPPPPMAGPPVDRQALFF